MRKQFVEYYDLSEKQIKHIWENSLIILDTNVLLNLYRYNDDARNEFLKVLEAYNDRLWIPYQVGLEFHSRRKEIIRKHSAAYIEFGDELSEQLLKIFDTVSSKYSRHPYIDFIGIKKKVQRSAETIKRSLAKHSEEHPDLLKNDPVLETITRLFDGRTGEDFTDKMLEDLYEDGEKRYSSKVPPGYCDEKNKKGQDKRSIYGDLIVWKQIIQYCKEQKKPIIFLTDDHKSDWWEKVGGKHSPRKELIKEFVNNTGCNILMYDSQRFLEYAKTNTDFKVSNKTIKEVSKLHTLSPQRINKIWEQMSQYHDLFASVKPLDFDFNYIASNELISDHIRNLMRSPDWLDSHKRLMETINYFQIHDKQLTNDDEELHNYGE